MSMWKIQILGVTLISDGKAVSYDLPPIESPYRPMVGDQWLCCSGVLATIENVTWHPQTQTLMVTLDDEVDVSEYLGGRVSDWLSLHDSMMRGGWTLDIDVYDECPVEIRDVAATTLKGADTP